MSQFVDEYLMRQKLLRDQSVLRLQTYFNIIFGSGSLFPEGNEKHLLVSFQFNRF